MSTPQWALERISKAKLNNSTFLDLSREYSSSLDTLDDVPDDVFGMLHLTKISLKFNRLTSLSKSIIKLQNLASLDLTGNRFTYLPEGLTGLQNLTELNLTGNQFSNLPESITELCNLKALVLINNQLTSLPESIGGLQSLKILNLGGNQLTSLPESIGKLQDLTSLYLIGNQLISLPRSIVKLQNLVFLNLTGNQLSIPPQEVAEKGIQAIREYFRQLIEQGQDQLYEAKFLILGEGGAGKTTLAKKIKDENYVLRDETSTLGMDVTTWLFPIDGGKTFRVNIWDFGGQEIYHATHQFFLTKRSLYALVADSRKEDTDFYFWLNVVELLSENSPLLIIKNEKKDRHRDLNERQLRGQFENLKEVLAVNFATNRGMDKLKDAIEHYLKNLPHIGSPLPSTWVRVRERLEADSSNYITDMPQLLCPIGMRVEAG